MKKLSFLVLIIALLISCKKEPSASFTYTGTLEVGVSIQFTNQSSHADTYTWDFGDGTLSTDVSPNHMFEKPGIYNVTLTAEGSGKSSTSSQALKVKGTTFTYTNSTGVTLYDFFTFYDNGHHIEEYHPLGILSVDQTTQVIKSDHNRISFGFKFITGGDYFINTYPFSLLVGSHNDLVITDTISITAVTISRNLKESFRLEPATPVSKSFKTW